MLHTLLPSKFEKFYGVKKFNENKEFCYEYKKHRNWLEFLDKNLYEIDEEIEY